MISENLRISVVTPSLNMLSYLKRCIRSVADQQAVSLEHIVVDGGSNDGTVELLRNQKGIITLCESDKGMYDAVNKGMMQAKGDIISYLNCDEQYLPNALEYVVRYFRDNPNIDIIFGGSLLVRPDGTFLAFRKSYTPRWYYIQATHLYLLSCSMFFRRKIVDDGFRFDDRLKVIADYDFVIRALRHGYRGIHVRPYLAAFVVSGTNLSTGKKAAFERNQAHRDRPFLIKCARHILNGARVLEKILACAYWQRTPFEYSLYSGEDSLLRTNFKVVNSFHKWPSDWLS